MKNNNVKMMASVVMILIVSTLGTMVSLVFHENRILSHLHIFFGVIMFVTVIFHLAQNWKWICVCMFKQKPATRKACSNQLETE